jgi:hypothetical protein
MQRDREQLMGLEETSTIRRSQHPLGELARHLLLKVRAVPVHARPDDQLRDVVQLLGFIDDPRAARAHLSAREQNWLKDISARLDFEGSIWREQFTATHVQRARAAFALLTP